MATLVQGRRSISDRDMRKALACRLSAWTAMDAWKRPICTWPADVRREIDEVSDRFATCKAKLVAGLWQRRGRWSDPANRVEMILDADGDSYLLFAPGVVLPGVKQVKAAEVANARRFG